MHYNVWCIKNNLLEINSRLVRKLSWIEKLTHIISDKDSFYAHFDHLFVIINETSICYSYFS